ncbi:MAG: tRNA (adenosine(37)-N6)-threonylcarbamoyltransferase complex ATPase subunit type 1 TsaE [Bacilli bacterium]
MKHTFKSKNELETLTLGEKLATLLKVGDVILLTGDLGAGKTTITKGIARGLNIEEKVNSPTFNIMKIYLKGTTPLFHIDAYRLEDNQDDIGLDEFIGGEGITVIEWPLYIKHLLPNNALEINIKHISLEVREITFFGQEHYENVIKKIAEDFK